MRKVKVKYCKREKLDTRWVYNDYEAEWLFHQWWYSYEEVWESAGNYSVAIVELEDWEIVLINPENVTFLK